MRLKILLSWLIFAFSLGACGSGDTPIIDFPPIVEEPPFLLKSVDSSAELERSLKDGLINTYGSMDQQIVFTTALDTFNTDILNLTPTFTPTNLQELGVDEADRIKTDGSNLFVLDDYSNKLKILDLNPETATAENLSELNVIFDAQAQYQVNPDSLYLFQNDNLSQIVTTGSSFAYGIFYCWTLPGFWGDQFSYLSNVKVDNPAAPVQDTTLKFDGTIVSSRRIGDNLYLVNRFQPFLNNLTYFDTDSAADNLAIIEAAELTNLMPSYSSSVDGISKPLVTAEDCYLPVEQAAENASADIITVVSINLNDMSVQDSKCYIGATETLYVSSEAMYLSTSRFESQITIDEDGDPVNHFRDPNVETDIHKFALNNGQISYKASGVVPGSLNDDAQRRPFRFSEDGTDLRVVTDTKEYASINSPVTLSVLRDDNTDELKVIGSLPNALRPEAIGKPEEDIYAVRYIDDKAYLVTFRVVDPLYVLDLSDASDPFIAGELEIPGYSDYLHPLGSDFLLGLGKDAIPSSGDSSDLAGAWFQGIKISLFDVSNPALPIEVQSISIGDRGTNSEALNNHHAFTLLPATQSTPARLAIGMNVYGHEAGFDPVSEPWKQGNWRYSGLHLFDIATGANPSITEKGIMKVDEFDLTGPTNQYPAVWWSNERSVIVEDTVFYINGYDVYAGFLSSPENFNGPY